MLIKGELIQSPRFPEDRICPNCIFLGYGKKHPDYDMYICLDDGVRHAKVCFTRSEHDTTKQAIGRIEDGYPQTQEAYSMAREQGIV